MEYSYTKKINLSFLEALDEVRIAFTEKGFGIVSNVNVSEKIKKKCSVNFGEYVVLGVCKPELAYEFLSEHMDFGVFIPCSIAVYEKEGSVYISAGLPDFLLSMNIDNKSLVKLSEKLSLEIKNIVDNI